MEQFMHYATKFKESNDKKYKEKREQSGPSKTKNSCRHCKIVH